MKLINQSAQYLPQGEGIDGIYKQIELAGRTSYLSWDKMVDTVSVDLSTLTKNITVDDIPDYKLHPKECIKFLNDNKLSYHVVDSSKKFVDMLIKSKHCSVLEHGTVYLKMHNPGIFERIQPHNVYDYVHNPYCKHKERFTIDDPYIGATTYYITTNLRVLQENNWLDDLKYLCEPTEFHENRLSVKVVTSRSISLELVRHRSMSFIQESQRYVGYTKDKFGGEITYIIPSWSSLPLGTVLLLPKNSQESVFCIRQENIDSPVVIPDKNGNLEFVEACAASEREYRYLINQGFKPQEAREVLPNATKTTIVITAFESDWREWFAQRLFGETGQPHPDMLVLANLIKEEFEKAGVWEGIMKYPSKYD